jgi:hypothetical protein
MMGHCLPSHKPPRRQVTIESNIRHSRQYLAFPTFVSPHEAYVQWLWGSNTCPSSNTGEVEWQRYSDVETAMIEEAFQKKLPKVLLDEYHIDFQHLMQVSNNNVELQKPIKRTLVDQSEKRVRQERFISNEILRSVSYNAYPFPYPIPLAPFINIICRRLQIDETKPSLESTDRDILVVKAAEGIILESSMVGKKTQGEWMATHLLQVKTDSEAVAHCCARLYCMDSFLYRKLNESLWGKDDPKQKHLWENKITTFGPFILLLCKLGLRETDGCMTVYRGLNLPDDSIEQLKTTRETLRFPALTSTTRNPEVAEMFSGNVTFCIDINSSIRSMDVAAYSSFPDEEEQILDTDFCFEVRGYYFDTASDKWRFHLSANYTPLDFLIGETLNFYPSESQSKFWNGINASKVFLNLK